jgi:hypothetical protein
MTLAKTETTGVTAGLELATIKCMMGANPSKARSSALSYRRFEETP